jgi:hypothetical protein
MPDPKVTADHLQRDAYLYVRQSTLRQVAENGESTQRQYALRDRAIAAGWLGDEFAPCVAGGVDDVVVGLEDEV